jgi:hypothetical protein
MGINMPVFVQLDFKLGLQSCLLLKLADTQL